MTDSQTEADKPGSRRALVTGAASELGREIVLTLARDGYDIALAYNETAPTRRSYRPSRFVRGKNNSCCYGSAVAKRHR